MKRAIYAGRVASYQAKQPDEMQAVADALSLLANLVMAWNTMKLFGEGVRAALTQPSIAWSG